MGDNHQSNASSQMKIKWINQLNGSSKYFTEITDESIFNQTVSLGMW